MILVAVELVTARVLEKRPDAALVEASECDQFSPAAAPEIAEGGAEGMGPVDVGVAEGDRHEHRGVRVDPSREVAQQRDASRIGPVSVIEDDEHRCLGCGRLDERDRRIEEAKALGVGIDLSRRRAVDPQQELGQDPGKDGAVHPHVIVELAVGQGREQPSERFGPRRVRRLDVLVASTERHDRSRVVDLAGELGYQPGLADAGLALDEHGRAGARRRLLPLCEERGAVVVPAAVRELAGSRAKGTGQWGGRVDGVSDPRDRVADRRFVEAFQLDLADQ